MHEKLDISHFLNLNFYKTSMFIFNSIINSYYKLELKMKIKPRKI